MPLHSTRPVLQSPVLHVNEPGLPEHRVRAQTLPDQGGFTVRVFEAFGRSSNPVRIPPPEPAPFRVPGQILNLQLLVMLKVADSTSAMTL